MIVNHILIDLENVQPNQLERLKNGSFKVIIFAGPNQTKIPIEMASALQALGSDVEYIRMEKSGRNALDFHIAYYVGVLSQQDPTAHFHIVSKDAGFDPLLEHLKAKKITAKRVAGIGDIAVRKAAAPAPEINLVDRVVTDLSKRKQSRPGTEKSLRSTIHALFKKGLSEKELDALMGELVRLRIVKIDGAKVAYELPEVKEKT